MNLTMLLDMAADGFGDRVVAGSQTDGLTATRLRELAIGGAGLLREAGSDALVYLAVNGPAFPVALFAAAYAGVPLVPVNYRLGGQQVDAILGQHPRAYLVRDAPLPGVTDQPDPGALSPAEWLAATAGRALDQPEQPGEPASADGHTGGHAVAHTGGPAAIIYTSGTTSAPKGVVLSHANLVSYVLGSVEFAAADADDAALLSVPPYHIAAVSNTITNLYAGRRVSVLENFDAARWLERVRGERITQAMVVPTMLARILADDTLDTTAPSLRTLSYGGAKMPLRVIETALRTWPHVDFVNAYGLTETSSTVTILGPDEHRAALESDVPAIRNRLGSAGRAIPGIEIEIRDGLNRPLAPGESGLIWIRGEQVSGEYSGEGSSVDPQGFFCTRDQGCLDTEGYLFIEGRVDDTIIRGGENIAPAEIEDVLFTHPAVVDAVVVGVPDDEWGQRIEAAVVLNPQVIEATDDLRDYLRRHLRSSKTPERIVVWPELPRTVTGKLVRRDVVARLAETS